MAGERILPGLGLTGFWALGDDTWKAGMDANIRVLSAIAPGVVDSQEATEPGVPVDGDIVIATTDWTATVTNQSIQVRDNGAWVEIVPKLGWTMRDSATNVILVFNGTAWETYYDPTALDLTVISDVSAARVLTDADFSGRKLILMDNVAAQTVTINVGLVNTQPLTVIQYGAGQVTIGGTATLQAADANLKTRVQFSAVTIQPIGSDVFTLVGDLTA